MNWNLNGLAKSSQPDRGNGEAMTNTIEEIRAELNSIDRFDNPRQGDDDLLALQAVIDLQEAEIDRLRSEITWQPAADGGVWLDEASMFQVAVRDGTIIISDGSKTIVLTQPDDVKLCRRNGS